MPRPRFRLPGRASTLGRPVIVVVAVLVVLALAVASFALLRDSNGSASSVRTEDAVRTLPESPGSSATVDIDTTLYLPDTDGPVPAVLLAHGFGGDKNSVAAQARDLASRGLVVLAYSARGFGLSTGSIGLNDPDREVADARGLIDYLATRPEVQLDSPGDPRVGVAGGSYGGALALMAAGTDPRIDADAASITWNDLNQSLFPNYSVAEPSSQAPTPAVSEGSDAGVLKRGWAGIFFGAGAAPAPGGAGDAPTSTAPAGACGRFALQVCLAYAESAVSGQPSEATSELLRARSPRSFASSITAPTLLVQGQRDTLFGLDQADATARQIAAAGGSVQVRWFDGGHDAGGTDATADGAVADFLVQHLIGDGTDSPRADSAFTYALAGDPTDQGDRARMLTAAAYPGLSDATPTERQDFPLTSATGNDTQTVVRPPGGSPAALTSLPGVGSASVLGGAAAGLGGAASALLTGDIPGQTASFVTEPLDSSYTIVGTSSVSVTVGPTTSPSGTVLFAKLYDVSDDGRRTLPNGLVSAVRVPPSDQPSTVSVTLPGMAYQVAAGNRVEVAFSTTDQAYAVPLEPAAVSVTLSDATLALPEVPAENAESTFPWVPVVGIAGLAVLVAALVALASFISRRRTVAEVDESLVDVPLVITDLAKSYSNGFRAVDGVSFRVGAGQVLGLLGPNGAGKTTTLRMLMGLITPSSGEIRVFGHLVSPGAPVLSRLGSFVEGSGFLPHLSGMENLDLYWKATGRPAEDAHLEEALEIADLGTAIHRKVRSYSQGMRQRLAIAQAMLGLPDLMVLDEPTNGLDPPQIRTMRDVLIRYAQTGRTVLVSSHLLAEVEQTCTHVVVMNKGVVISSGTVDDLIGASGPLEFRVDRPADAVSVLRGIDGMGEVVEAEPEGAIKAQLGVLDPAMVVRTLVGAGIGVSSASRSTRLEDVFLDLVHDDTDRLRHAAEASSGNGTTT
ncbi:alpha/beta fold hydrolase [Rhodococcus sp. BP-332]|uniref:alpha/beta fold hydrolase n=1 Tax=Rhodococcus sp. BP-332 TaxID=2739447 RepID=UPI001C9B5991|nr:alpha/beta fold hydrolase [Rhodococcus sp. BP-332]MBY6678261.1 alpha/beta fold hydrolase [Rhodococcus sp. BP-332]